ncbi:MAG: response regulator [Algibacter sp.]|uniref:response regulator n=1 Tax=Algibacter sp. TaxID=1872428 RepID=UPI0026131148|nr:response regulator [Algibacter sp.]MDG1730075.1 response regulator [Algibacter sp.]MDG2179817.1 response regulator [Algibacter sp.]
MKKKLSFFIFISIAVILIIGYAFLDKKIYTKSAAAFLFILAIVQVFVLQFFLRNQLRNDVIKANLRLRVDELKESLDSAEELASHKSIYLSNMSYEIRTPLNTVLGMLNMLKQTALNGDQTAQVEIAEYSSKHLLQLVNMITYNAEANKGNLELNLKSIDLKTDLSKLFKVLEYQAWEKSLEFEYKFLSEEKDNFLVIGDTAKIQQVLINLVNNAIKFTNAGKISIIVDQSVGIDNDQIITFYIKDTGVGMKPEEVKQVFNIPDGVYSNSILKDYRGGGMGISISQKLVEFMGGELKLESKENEGSTFYFSLQLKKTFNLKAVQEIEKPILSDKFNVLVAEDNRMNQKVIKFLLERQGADCTFAKNGLEAVDLYKILDFDMVFMDIYMPNMDGYEATKFIKETDKYLVNKTPIIGVSASAFEKDIEKAKHAGIDDFLAKPIEVKKLKNLLVKFSKTKTSA